MTQDEIHYHILRILEEDPALSQRELARRLGVSVGRTHYALRALVERGSVKAGNFAQSQNKVRYFYKLTPSGISEKLRLARAFLARKREEHAAIQAEIEALKAELASDEE